MVCHHNVKDGARYLFIFTQIKLVLALRPDPNEIPPEHHVMFSAKLRPDAAPASVVSFFPIILATRHPYMVQSLGCEDLHSGEKNGHVCLILHPLNCCAH
jgi:hypothetical protein